MILLRQRVFSIFNRKTKKHLWVETPDGKKFRYVGRTEENTSQEFIDEAKKKVVENLKKDKSNKYTIDQFKFYFE